MTTREEEIKVKKAILKRRVYGWLLLILMTAFVGIVVLFPADKLPFTENQVIGIVAVVVPLALFVLFAWLIQTFKTPTKEDIADKAYHRKVDDEIDKL